VTPWIGRALERSPVYGPAHAVLARWLRGRSPSQARLEYRIAQEQGGVELQLPELVGLVNNNYEAIEIAPTGTAGVDVLNGLSMTMSARLPSSAVRVDAEIDRRHPNHVPVLQRRAAAAWSDIEQSAPWCSTDCLDAAFDIATRLRTIAPLLCDGYVLEAQVLIQTRRAGDGLNRLRSAIAVVERPERCLATLARLAIDSGHDEEATYAIEQLANRPCASPDSCATTLAQAAELEQRRHSPNRAMVYLRRAAQAAPTREDILLARANAAMGLGLRAEAAESYEQLLAQHPGNAVYQAGLRAAHAN